MWEDEEEIKKEDCRICNNTSSLDQKGIIEIYLKPAKWSIIFMIIGALSQIFISNYAGIITVVAAIYPLALADLRMYLYPVAAIGKLMGKQLNCPKCEPGCNIFRVGD